MGEAGNGEGRGGGHDPDGGQSFVPAGSGIGFRGRWGEWRYGEETDERDGSVREVLARVFGVSGR